MSFNKVSFLSGVIKVFCFLLFTFYFSFLQAQSFRQQAENSYHKGYYINSLQMFDMAINANKKDTMAWFGRGLARMAINDYQGAGWDFKKVSKLDPSYVKAYIYWGICDEHNSDYWSAIKHFSKAILIDPKKSEAYDDRANAEYSISSEVEYASDTLDAMKDYNMAIELDSNNADAWYDRGFMEHAHSHYPEAIEDFTVSIALDPDNEYAFFYRGNSLDSLHQYRDAVGDYNTALRLAPKSIDAYYNRGLDKAKLAFYDGAIDDFTSVLSLDSTSSVAYYNRGMAKLSLQNYAEAIKDFNSAIIWQDDYTDAIFARGLSYLGLKDNDRACIDFDRASDLGNASAKKAYEDTCKQHKKNTDTKKVPLKDDGPTWKMK